MQPQSCLLLSKDILPNIVVYSIEDPDLFKKRNYLHNIAQVSRLLRTVCSDILNRKENKETIKYLIKAHDWVEESLLTSTPKNCPYGIKTKDNEKIGYLIARKQRRLNALNTLANSLVFTYNDSKLALQNLNAIIAVLNKKKIILQEEGHFLQTINQAILKLEEVEPSESVRKIIDYINMIGLSTVASLMVYKKMYDQPIFNYEIPVINTTVFSFVITSCSWMLSIDFLKTKRIINLHKTFKKHCSIKEIEQSPHHTILPITSTLYERYLDSINLND